MASAAPIKNRVGNLAGSQVKFCAACCRVNTSSEALCFSCRSGRGRSAFQAALPRPLSAGLRRVRRLLIFAVLGAAVAVVWGVAMGTVAVRLSTVAAYVVVVFLAVAAVHEAPSRRCPGCGSARVGPTRSRSPRGIVVGTARDLECRRCRLPVHETAGHSRSFPVRTLMYARKLAFRALRRFVDLLRL